MNTNDTKIDMLAIGDIVTDAFIKLKDAHITCKLDNTSCELCMRYGDKIPYESVEVCTAVGNSANAAVSGARLGLHSALLSYVGDDQNGKECIEELERNGVDATFVHTEAGKKTNYHYVLWYEVDRTILIKHETFMYSLKGVNEPNWIYLSSLGENSLPFHMEIADYLEANPEVKLAFQPGTFQIKLGKDKLERIYKKAEVFFCNVEEAQIILGSTSRDLPELLKGMSDIGPKIIIITDGINGAYAFDKQEMWFMPVYPHKPVERTGAGDAFASTIISALIKGKTLGEALTWGPINSMSVVQQVGAQKGLLSEEKLKEFLISAPQEYALKKL